MNIFEKALSGGLAAIIVYAIYWVIQLILSRKGSTRRIPNSNEPAQEKTINRKDSKDEFKPNLPNLNDIKVRFNYYYAFRWIPEKIELYKKGKESIMTVIDVASIIREHTEYRQIASNIEYALTQNEKNQSIN